MLKKMKKTLFSVNKKKKKKKKKKKMKKKKKKKKKNNNNKMNWKKFLTLWMNFSILRQMSQKQGSSFFSKSDKI